MHSPSPATLLRGVADGLEADVLPLIGDGAAQRQLKASLHILRRLERSWDRMPAYLVLDADDMLDTLTGLDIADAALRARLSTAENVRAELRRSHGAAPIADLVAQHDELQHCVVAAEAWLRADAADCPERAAALAALHRLYARMLEREAFAWATGATG